jgi:hypothetical protein
MTISRWLCALLAVVVALAGPLAPVGAWAQAQAPGPAAAAPGGGYERTRYIDELTPTPATEGHRVGAVFVNMVHVPGKAILCGVGTLLSTTVLLLTFGSGYPLAVKTFEEGCHGDWVLKPEHLSGQIQRPPDL